MDEEGEKKENEGHTGCNENRGARRKGVISLIEADRGGWFHFREMRRSKVRLKTYHREIRGVYPDCNWCCAKRFTTVKKRKTVAKFENI